MKQQKPIQPAPEYGKVSTGWVKALGNMLFHHQFIRNLPERIVEEFDAAAARGEGLEVAFLQDPMSKLFELHPIGVINGLLAQKNMTLVGQFDEAGEFIGLDVKPNTRFGEPVDATQ